MKKFLSRGAETMNCYHCDKKLNHEACNCKAEQVIINKIMLEIETQAWIEKGDRENGK